jgi:tRNA dimethylallyltransferase
MKWKSGSNVSNLEKIIIISGPTASGKTAFAIDLAKKINGAIISADSVQVYKGLDIGSAKASWREMAGVDHYLIDIVYPNQPYSVADFQRDGRSAIATILSRGQVPIVVGGSGLYIQSLLFDYVFDTIEPLDYSRYDAYANTALVARLRVLDERSAASIDGHNRRRIVHALALAEQTGQTKSEREAKGRPTACYDCFACALMPERTQLYERINKRVEQMVAAGLTAEAVFFNEKFTLAPQIKQAIGYRESLAYAAAGYLDERAYIATVAQNTRRFAKRQVTWLKNQRIPYHFIKTPAEAQVVHQLMCDFLQK